jgi:TRAP transporter TAXI family solute receptor
MILNRLVSQSCFCASTILAVVVAMLFAGCNPDQGSKGSGSGGGPSSQSNSSSATLPRFIPLGTAGSAGVFFIMGNSIAEVLNESKGDAKWTVQPSGTKGTQQNILMLDKGEIVLGMANAAISYHAVNGLGIWNQPYQIRNVATLAPNVGLFVTKKDSGIRTFADLKGKRIAVGPAGAGFETFLSPLMTAHGVAYTCLLYTSPSPRDRG